MVEECGAKFEKLKVSDCTHLITTPECYHSEKAPAKSECLKTASVTVGLVKLLMTKFRTSVTEAQRNPNCNIISIDWLLGSIKKKEPLNTRGFLIRALGSKRLVPPTTGANAKPSPTSNLKRKPTTEPGHKEGRRAKISKNRVLANCDKLSALVDQASHEEAGRCLVLTECTPILKIYTC